MNYDMRIRSVIIDDEPHNLENLKGLIALYCPNVDVVAMAASAKEGREIILREAPDLVFLDIEMPGANGFAMLEDLGKVNFQIVFVTAYSKYTLKAIKACALDYLMKPVDVKELVEAVAKVSEVLNTQKENKKLKVLVNNLRSINEPQKIALPTAEQLYFVSTKDIIRCQSDNNYTKFFLANGTSILVSKTLKEWDELLDPSLFIRTHQSHLINKNYVSSYVKKDGGYILMKDGSHISVSKQRKELTLQMLVTLK